jgi:hypothetical protein
LHFNVKGRLRRGDVTMAASATPQNFVKQLVGAPVMITLPIAYAVALFFVQAVGFPNILAALIAAFLVYAADWYSSDPAWKWPRDYVGRLIYVVINTAILTLVLLGVISLGEASG